MQQGRHGWARAFTNFFTASLLCYQPFASADEIKYLAEPQQSLAAFARAIEGARSSIDFATFIFEACHPSTQAIIARLAEQARQGVKVRVIVDALEQSEEQKRNLASYFARAGAELRLFNTNLFEINFRMHAKFMAVDRKVLLAGGRNIADQYFAVSSRLNYVDRDILASGDLGAEAANAFERLWRSDKVYPTPLAERFEPWEKFCKGGDELGAKRQVIENDLAAHGMENLKRAPTRVCDHARFWLDDPDFANPQFGPPWNDGQGAATFLTSERLRRKHSTRQVLSFISHANKNLLLENESYLPITGLERAFAQARARGVAISVLSNQDMDEGPQFFLDIIEYEYAKIAARDNTGSERVRLVSSRGSLNADYEWTPPGVPAFLHGKVAVRDDKDVLVGSFNLDGRSANINVETAITIPNCPALAQDLKKGMSQVRRAFETDAASGQIPPKRPASFLTMLLGDILLPQL